MLSRRLIIFLIVGAGICGYLYFAEGMRQWLLPGGILIGLAILTYVMQYQIDWMWYKKYPPKLPESIHKLYLTAGTFYAKLSEEDRVRFGTRVTMFIAAKEFLGQGMDDIAEDLKYMVAYYAVVLTFYQDRFLFKGYDRIVFYVHPFLTPHQPDDVHTYEVEHMDGTIILTVAHLTKSFMEPTRYYCTGLHAMAEAMQVKYPVKTELTYPADIWQKLESISTITRPQIEEFTGLQQEDPWPVAVHHWHIYQARFLRDAPDLAARLKDIFE